MCVLAVWSSNTPTSSVLCQNSLYLQSRSQIYVGLKPSSLTSSDVYFDMVPAFERIKLTAAGLCATIFSSR